MKRAFVSSTTTTTKAPLAPRSLVLPRRPRRAPTVATRAAAVAIAPEYGCAFVLLCCCALCVWGAGQCFARDRGLMLHAAVFAWKHAHSAPPPPPPRAAPPPPQPPVHKHKQHTQHRAAPPPPLPPLTATSWRRLPSTRRCCSGRRSASRSRAKSTACRTRRCDDGVVV